MDDEFPVPWIVKFAVGYLVGCAVLVLLFAMGALLN